MAFLTRVTHLRLRKDIDESREGKRREHLWGSRGYEYEKRRDRSRRERSPSPDRNETEAQKRKRMEDEYKKGYERARREIARRSVSVRDQQTVQAHS